MTKQTTADQAMQAMPWMADATKFWKTGLEGSMAGGFGETLQAMNKEGLAFFQDRVAKDAAFVQKLTEARDPVEVARINTEFYETLFDDYRKQMLKMALAVTTAPKANGHDAKTAKVNGSS
jgi:Phasin protein